MKIVLSVVLTMLIVGCSDEKSSHKSVENVTPVTQAKEVTMPKKEVLLQEHAEKTPIKEVTTAIEKKVQKSAKKVTETVKAAPIAKSVSGTDGAKLFMVCSSCHGAHAEKKALGKSQIIKGWDAAKIAAALQGYKDGSYGGAMKAIMKGQVTKLSDADIKSLANYISKL